MERDRKTVGMTTLFTRLINGELPARFVWSDPQVVAFLTIAPLTPGHTLVVPRAEVDHWTDAESDLLAACVDVAQEIGRAVQQAWGAPRAGLVIAGFEVPHLHLHVFPAWSLADFDFRAVDPHPDPDDLDAHAEKLRAALRHLGHHEPIPDR
jgi:diadenosine tetraphosphate (Ap4A) HIT family hydrolase